MSIETFKNLEGPGWYGVPERMRSGIAGYILDGVPMGDFLTACFEDKLVAAFKCADGENARMMVEYAKLLYNEVPTVARGSREIVRGWIESGGYNGQQAAATDEDRCTNPGGHVWNRTAGEADEARLSRDYANDNIRCIYCGADGDA